MYAIRTLEDAFAATTLQHRTATILLVVFAGVAVALAALGVYAVMAQSVAARRQEIGVRMALGAGSADVVRMITGQALRLLLIGASLGVLGGVALGRVASSLLVDTSPSDPFVLAAVTAALVAKDWRPGGYPHGERARSIRLRPSKRVAAIAYLLHGVEPGATHPAPFVTRSRRCRRSALEMSDPRRGCRLSTGRLPSRTAQTARLRELPGR